MKQEINKDVETGQGDGEGIVQNDDSVTVMVLGAGRGPLVRATLNAAEITNTKVKVAKFKILKKNQIYKNVIEIMSF